MNCKNCGYPLTENDHFCKGCGFEVTNDTANIEKRKKKRLHWEVPLLLWFGFVFCKILEVIIRIIGGFSNNKTIITFADIIAESELLNIIAIILPLLGFISIPIVIFMYTRKSGEEIDEGHAKINNFLMSNDTIENKLLVAYIGINYEKIMSLKFSIPSLFLSVIYLSYRKLYLFVIIILLGFNLLELTLGEMISSIIITIFGIVLGINFNKWYVDYCKKQVNKIIQRNNNMTFEQLVNICQKKGGTNLGMSIAFWLILMIITIAISLIV